MKIQAESDEKVQDILNRAILVKDFIELWAEAESLEALHQKIQENLDIFSLYRDCSFKFLIKSYGKAYTPQEQVDIINSFAYSNLQGAIRMKDPEVIYGVFVDRIDEGGREYFYFGRYVGRSLRGKHLERMDLKKREYLGTTSMDAELSLVMSNMGLVQPGSFVYDPFVGTGSFLYTCSYFGAYTMGSDIDGRQMRGKLKSSTKNRGPKYKKTTEGSSEPEEFPSIFTNVRQYNLTPLVLDCLVFDMSHHPFSGRLKFSAIVTDPPYGVRAGAKKLGVASPKDSKPIPHEYRPITYPSTQPYAIDELTKDLYTFASEHLLPQGRLVFWYPVDEEERESFNLQSVICHPKFKFVAASRHQCKGFDRWLITMELTEE